MDEEFKYVCKKNKLKIYWINKPLVHQGSIYGYYTSTNIISPPKTNNIFKKINFIKNKLYDLIESKRFTNEIYLKPIILIKDILQEIEVQLKYYIFKKE